MANDICSEWGNATVAPSSRTLHLVDADNLLGDPTTTDRSFIASTFDAYRNAASYRAGDHVVVATGCNGAHVFEVEAAWPGVLHRRRSGTDGADLALLEEAEWAASSGRFGRVVIGSGDRVFVVALDLLRSVDLIVDVVARSRSLARCLAIRALGHVSELLVVEPLLRSVDSVMTAPLVGESATSAPLVDYVAPTGIKRRATGHMTGSGRQSMELMASA